MPLGGRVAVRQNYGLERPGGCRSHWSNKPWPDQARFGESISDSVPSRRCVAAAHDDSDKITVEAFDYIEYPKILTQPDANPAELVRRRPEAVPFAEPGPQRSRGDFRLRAKRPGRFIKLPPVEAKKIPDIVRYEARQQIPFDLNDVIWDYQRMGGGSEESGFVLETEIGLFAMKRDAVFRALKPFVEAGIEVDIMQLAPLALYNYVVFDMLQGPAAPEEYDPDDPPESIVLVSLGTDATDLVVTNGYQGLAAERAAWAAAISPRPSPRR